MNELVEILVFSDAEEAAQTLDQNLKDNETTVDKISAKGEEQQRAYKESTGFIERWRAREREEGIEGTVLSVDAYSVALPPEERKEAWKGCGIGHKLYCPIDLVKISNEYSFEITVIEDISLGLGGGQIYGPHTTLSDLAEGVIKAIEEMREKYFGAEIIPVFFTIDEMSISTKDEASMFLSFINRISGGAIKQLPESLKRQVAGIARSITEGLSEEERDEFPKFPAF